MLGTRVFWYQISLMKDGPRGKHNQDRSNNVGTHAQSHTHTQTHNHIYVICHTHIYIYIYNLVYDVIFPFWLIGKNHSTQFAYNEACARPSEQSEKVTMPATHHQDTEISYGPHHHERLV